MLDLCCGCDVVQHEVFGVYTSYVERLTVYPIFLHKVAQTQTDWMESSHEHQFSSLLPD